MMTLLALALAVGIVIDDAIVVLENIFRFVEEKKMKPFPAAIHATKEIGMAVLATTLSLIAVFLPVAFMSGIIGRFMQSFGLTMAFAIVMSLLVSFTLTPMLSSRWLKGSKKPKHPLHEGPHGKGEEDPELRRRTPPSTSSSPTRLPSRAPWSVRSSTSGSAGCAPSPPSTARAARRARSLYGRFERAYLRMLAFVMRHRWIVGIAMLVTLFAIGPLGKAVAKNFLPLNDESRFEVSIRAPEGSSLSQTELICQRLARRIRALAGVDHTVITVGSPPGTRAPRDPTRHRSTSVSSGPPSARPISRTSWARCATR